MVRFDYSNRFMARAVELKNAAAHRRLGEFDKVFYAPGLGVSNAYWSRRGTSLTTETAERARPADMLRELARAPQLTLAPGYVFLGSTKRLHLAPEVRPTTRNARLPWAVMQRAPAIAGRALALGNRQLCTTIHEYRPAASLVANALGRELLIFVDGHHPSNYPRSYLDMYLSGSFVCANHASAGWFQRHGRTVLPPTAIQTSERFARATPHSLSTVLLVMNHAGDWTSLINRSDSDTLIEAFASIATSRRDLRFIIRLHPTMATPTHEGVHSITRVRNWIASLGLPNLSVSDASLEDDLARAELYVSEYSQVLIDAWQRGHRGIAVNLTRRRSLMLDYERLGFPSASATSELMALIDEGPTALAERQNRAVEAFNARQLAWESS
jgi:hypothetical protein